MWHYQVPYFSGSGVGHGCFNTSEGAPATDTGRCPLGTRSQDRLYLLQAVQPFAVGQLRTAVDPLRRILTCQAQQPQVQAIGLLRMRLFCQAIADPLQRIGHHAGGPVFQSARRPLLMVAVRSGMYFP